jgi:integrase
MPVRRRKGSPFFWYSFSIAGRRFRGSTGCTSKREAEQVERDQFQLAKETTRRGEEWNLLTVLNTYWSEHAKDRRGHATIFTTLAQLQKGLGKDKLASALTAGDLMDYRAKRRGSDGVEARTVNRDFAYLRAAYEHCQRFHRQPVPHIDWKALKAKEAPGRTRFLSKDEYKSLIEVAHESLRPIIICAVSTGLRKDNILSLDWRQVKLAERVIQIKRTKSNRAHTVKIGNALVAALSRAPADKRRGKVFDLTNFRKRWDVAVKAAKLEDFRFHDLRHTFASWARIHGADLADIMEALDHSSISMTMRYAHILPETHRTAFDRVSDMVLGTIAGTDTQKTAEN